MPTGKFLHFWKVFTNYLEVALVSFWTIEEVTKWSERFCAVEKVSGWSGKFFLLLAKLPDGLDSLLMLWKMSWWSWILFVDLTLLVLCWSLQLKVYFTLCYNFAGAHWVFLVCPRIHSFLLLCIIRTEGTLRRPITSDNHPIHPYPIPSMIFESE